LSYSGWLIDSYIEDKNAVMWIKVDDGEALRLLDRHHPLFMARPAGDYDPLYVS
jgi:hypothetical protein